jgi:outer membrane protein, multidrug efflux system
MNVRRTSFFTRTLVALAALFTAACASGPDYKRPDVSQLVPTDWRWKIAVPSDAAPKGDWWTAFSDPALDRLEAAALADSQTLKAAVAKVEQARALARMSRSQMFPSVNGSAAYQHQRLSGNRPLPITMPKSVPMEVVPMNQDSHSISFDAAYELDLWGRVKRTNEADRALALAGDADCESVRLALCADVAATYFSLRSADEELRCISEAVKLREDSARILEERFEKGIIPEIDAAQAKTDLAQTRADKADAERQRAELFNALALLCGKAPAQFDIGTDAAPLATPPAPVATGLPASLLERRPDVAAAERRLCARCAQIGVARAAYFPSVSLVGNGGYLSTEADDLFTADSVVWSIAPKVSVPLFTAGRTKADVKRAEAAYDEAVANYRQAVLVAFRDVEDALADIGFLAQQDIAQDEALAFARQTATLAQDRYKAGYVDYMNVAAAERNVLAQERQKAKITSLRYTAQIRLIKALGGPAQGKKNNE